MGVIKTMYPSSFQEIMAALLTLMVWVFAIIVYIMTNNLPDWLIGLVTFSWGYWLKSPSQNS